VAEISTEFRGLEPKLRAKITACSVVQKAWFQLADLCEINDVVLDISQIWNLNTLRSV
jgi:hypothetical protein